MCCGQCGYGCLLNLYHALWCGSIRLKRPPPTKSEVDRLLDMACNVAETRLIEEKAPENVRGVDYSAPIFLGGKPAPPQWSRLYDACSEADKAADKQMRRVVLDPKTGKEIVLRPLTPWGITFGPGTKEKDAATMRRDAEMMTLYAKERLRSDPPPTVTLLSELEKKKKKEEKIRKGSLCQPGTELAKAEQDHEALMKVLGIKESAGPLVTLEEALAAQESLGAVPLTARDTYADIAFKNSVTTSLEKLKQTPQAPDSAEVHLALESAGKPSAEIHHLPLRKHRARLIQTQKTRTLSPESHSKAAMLTM